MSTLDLNAMRMNCFQMHVRCSTVKKWLKLVVGTLIFPLISHIVVLLQVHRPRLSYFGFLSWSAREHEVEYANQWCSPFLSRNRFQCPIVHTFLWSAALQASKALDAFRHTPAPDFLNVNWITGTDSFEPNYHPRRQNLFCSSLHVSVLLCDYLNICGYSVLENWLKLAKIGRKKLYSLLSYIDLILEADYWSAIIN